MKHHAPFRHHTINTMVWGSNVEIIVGGERRQRRALFERKGVHPKSQERWLSHMAGMHESGAVTMFDDDTPWQVFVYFPKLALEDWQFCGGVAHELLHAVIAILRRKKVVLSEDSEEAFTYFLEYLTREFWHWVNTEND